MWPVATAVSAQKETPIYAPITISPGRRRRMVRCANISAGRKSMFFPFQTIYQTKPAPLLEPMGVALYTVELRQLRPGVRVGVYGCGPIGLMVVQLARLSGALDVIATDKLAHRLEVAKRMGATAVFTADDTENIPDVDLAFEVAGDQGAVDTAVETCIPGGRVVLCGIPSDDKTSFKASTARRKGLVIQVVRRMKHTYPRAIRLVEAGLIDVESLVSHQYELDDGAEAFKAAESREGSKVVINP
jgi:L-iditol 2-dehydrogenase